MRVSSPRFLKIHCKTLSALQNIGQVGSWCSCCVRSLFICRKRCQIRLSLHLYLLRPCSCTTTVWIDVSMTRQLHATLHAVTYISRVRNSIRADALCMACRTVQMSFSVHRVARRPCQYALCLTWTVVPTVLTDRAFLAEPKTMLKAFILGGSLAAVFILMFSFMGTLLIFRAYWPETYWPALQSMKSSSCIVCSAFDDRYHFWSAKYVCELYQREMP